MLGGEVKDKNSEDNKIIQSKLFVDCTLEDNLCDSTSYKRMGLIPIMNPDNAASYHYILEIEMMAKSTTGSGALWERHVILIEAQSGETYLSLEDSLTKDNLNATNNIQFSIQDGDPDGLELRAKLINSSVLDFKVTCKYNIMAQDKI